VSFVPVVIRPAGPSAFDTVIDLAHRIWRAYYPAILPSEQIEYMLARLYTHEALAELLAQPHAGLALAQDGEPVGFAIWYGKEPGTVKLDKLYLLPERHGEGIGRALVDHVVDEARAARCHTLVLNVNRHNASSIRFYERCGFAIRDRGDFPIGNGFVMEDYIMARPLASHA
jgi:ribosomal protein S18 acetylase RimI-like enzyme